MYALHIPESTLFENNFEWSPTVITLNLTDKRFFFLDESPSLDQS